MTNKKPTDNEIVKALNQCACSETNCYGCPYWDASNCSDRLCMDALDLINRLQANVDNYKQIAENQQKIILDKAFENKKLKAEIERLTKSVTTLTKSISELTDEVERQKKAKDESFLFAANILESEKTVIAETKAEAYKEFAERLKQLKYQSSDWSHGEHPFVVEESDIDDTLYELVGEDND